MHASFSWELESGNLPCADLVVYPGLLDVIRICHLRHADWPHQSRPQISRLPQSLQSPHQLRRPGAARYAGARTGRLLAHGITRPRGAQTGGRRDKPYRADAASCALASRSAIGANGVGSGPRAQRRMPSCATLSMNIGSQRSRSRYMNMTWISRGERWR